MATENNKNISYPTIKDLTKRKKIVTEVVIKNDIKNKINLFINAIKTKHS